MNLRLVLIALSLVCSLAVQASYAAEIYELMTYSVKEGKQPILDDYLEHAYIPAIKKLGAGPVGVFTEKGSSAVYVVSVFSSLEQFGTVQEKLSADEEYKKAGAAYFDAKPGAAIYDRIDSSLLEAIPGMPKLGATDPSKPRIVNLRIYESHNERAAAKKIEMFDTAEIALFKRVGLTPVFFGHALAGPRRPNLTYMLVFPDEEARGTAWKKFGGDPEWKKLSSIPEFMDKEIVSKITNKVLTPTPYSGI